MAMPIAWRAALLAAAVAAFAASAYVPGARGAEPANVRAEITGTVTFSAGWCCGTTVDFTGWGVLPVLGSTTFTGTWLRGCAGVPSPVTTCMRQLSLVFVARTGDVLALSGEVAWQHPGEPVTELVWAVDRELSTGRLARFSGSGTYSVTELQGALVVSLSGSLVPDR